MHLPRAPRAIVLLLLLPLLYAFTLCPTVYWYDSAELAAAARSLGVPHPPGYPLYTLLAHLFTYLPGEPALGVNLMSLVFGLASAGLCYLIARQLDVTPLAAIVAALTLGVGKTFWWNAVVAEVYTPGLTFTLGSFWLLLRAVERERLRLVWLAALTGGLGVGVHMSIATLGLGYALLVLTFAEPVATPRALLACFGPRRLARTWRLRLRAVLGSALATAVGLLVFLYVPLRGNPPAGVSRQRWAHEVITGGRFKVRFMAQYDLGEQLELLYRSFADNLTLAGLLLAAVGLWVLGRRNPRAALALALAIGGNVWFFFNYSVHDIDVFYLPAVALAAVLLGAGLDAAADLVAGVLARGWPARAPLLRTLGLLLALALPLTHAVRHHPHCDLSDATEARDYARRLIAEVPRGARIVLYDRPFEWKRSAVLLYVQQGLGQRDDVVLLRRPALADVETRVAHGEALYVLVPLRRIAERPGLRLVEDGVLWRIVGADGE